MWFGTVKELIETVENNISQIIKELLKYERKANRFEEKSWRNSIPALSTALNIPELYNHHIFIEVKIPCSSCRCDAVLICFGKKNNRRIVIIELKQWKNCFAIKPEMVSFYEYDNNYERLHPCSQVEGYKNYLKNYDSSLVNKSIESEIFGCVFLHEMENTNTLSLGVNNRALEINKNLVEMFPVFGKNDENKLANWVFSKLPKPADNDFIEEFKRRKKKPSNKLSLDLKKIANMNRHPWVPLNFQREVFVKILDVFDEFLIAKKPKRKVIIVTGPPGSGKSILALAILLKAASDEYNITKSLLLTNHTYQKKTLEAALNLKTKKSIPPERKLTANPVLDSIKFVKDFCKQWRKTKLQIIQERKKRGIRNITQEEYINYASRWREEYLERIHEIKPVDLIVCDESQALIDPRDPTVVQKGTGRHWSPFFGPQAWRIIMSSIISIFFLDENQGYRQQERMTANGIKSIVKRKELEQ